jgi:hypothetical protein
MMMPVLIPRIRNAVAKTPLALSAYTCVAGFPGTFARYRFSDAALRLRITIAAGRFYLPSMNDRKQKAVLKRTQPLISSGSAKNAT